MHYLCLCRIGSYLSSEYEKKKHDYFNGIKKHPYNTCELGFFSIARWIVFFNAENLKIIILK